MALTACPDCNGKVSDKAFACPSCGHPMNSGKGRSQWPAIIGGVAGTYISANAVVTVVLGSVMMIVFAAIMIAAVMSS